jgi:hypothetical protein
MNQYRGRFQRSANGSGNPLFVIALVLALSACGKERGIPMPQSPPKPVTSSGYIRTAQYDLPARPSQLVAPPGWM